jgi:hypothetical protein
MSGPNIARIIARCESVLFPRRPLETAPGTAWINADSARAVLDGRRFRPRLEPFTGFVSPPGRL